MEAWQPHEVEDYRQVKSEYLDELYAARDILTTDPEERARLTSPVEVGLPDKDQRVFPCPPERESSFPIPRYPLLSLS